MYAVVRTGGKQYRVSPDDVIIVEKLVAEPGAALELDQVLMLGDGTDLQVGTPLVDGARVAATVLDQGRGDKIIVFKKKRRQNYRRTRGHRQQVTVLRITEILAKGQTARPAKAAAKPEETAAPAPAEAASEAAAAPAKKVPAKKAPTKKAAPRKAAARKGAAKKSPAKKAARKAAARKPKE
jgi:large subunit ribosomal protein L21